MTTDLREKQLGSGKTYEMTQVGNGVPPRQKPHIQPTFDIECWGYSVSPSGTWGFKFSTVKRKMLLLLFFVLLHFLANSPKH